MRRYAKLQGEAIGGPVPVVARAHGSGGGGGDSLSASGHRTAAAARVADLTYSVRCLTQLEDLLGCSLRLEDSELIEFVPDFMVYRDPAVEASGLVV